jgi:hypothetical protein
VGESLSSAEPEPGILSLDRNECKKPWPGRGAAGSGFPLPADVRGVRNQAKRWTGKIAARSAHVEIHGISGGKLLRIARNSDGGPGRGQKNHPIWRKFERQRPPWNAREPDKQTSGISADFSASGVNCLMATDYPDRDTLCTIRTTFAYSAGQPIRSRPGYLVRSSLDRRWCDQRHVPASTTRKLRLAEGRSGARFADPCPAAGHGM